MSSSSRRIKAANDDAFDQWWEWAEKPFDSPLPIDGDMQVTAVEPNWPSAGHRIFCLERIRFDAVAREQPKLASILSEPRSSPFPCCGFSRRSTRSAFISSSGFSWDIEHRSMHSTLH